MLTSPTSIPRSGLFHAPGRPLAPARTAQVRRLLAAELTAAASDHGLQVIDQADPDQIVLRGHNLDLARVCDFAEAALKQTLRRLPADLIGGANVTRLDGVLQHRHPRLPYRRALRIVASRGWRLALGDELTDDARASLVRFCGHLPVQVMHLAGQPQPGDGAATGNGVSYVVPWGGEVLRAEVPAGAQAGTAACCLRLDRLLDFVLGLDAAAHAG
jgi:hypothetical protein